MLRRELEAPLTEPLTLAEVKTHLRHSSTLGSTEDTYLNALIKAARRYGEAYCGRAFVPRLEAVYMRAFPDGPTMVLPWPDIRQVVDVRYRDTDGVVQQMPVADYRVFPTTQDTRIILNPDAKWPVASVSDDAVQVRFNAGFPSAESPDGADGVPHDIKAALLMIVAELYENREQSLVGTIRTENPIVHQLLHFHRVEFP
jgi:uncharacterized phiE125 gp8 family phage protein